MMLRFLCHLTICCFCLYTCTLCESRPETRFVMTPSYNDNFIILGNPLELNCTIETGEPELYSAGNITIKQNGLPLSSRANLSYYDEDLTLQLYIANVSLPDDGPYACYYNGVLQAFKIVHIGVPPDLPTNISCILYNFVRMECAFTPTPVDAHIPTDWTMSYRTDSESEVNKTCREIRERTVSISCDGPDPTDIVKGETYFINVEGFNQEYEFYVNASFDVYTDQTIVKPDPVANLSFLKIGRGRVVNLTWMFPPHLDTFIALVYRIHIEGQDGWDTRTMVYTPADNPASVSYDLDGLVPFCNYTVAVSCQPVSAHGEIYWSNTSTVRFQTNQDVPGRSTTLAPGSYFPVATGKDRFRLVLYWKNPDPVYSHGHITGYQIISNHTGSVLVPGQIYISHNSTVQEADGVTGFTDNSTWSNASLIGYNSFAPVSVENVTGYRVSVMLGQELEKADDYVVQMKTATTVGYSDTVSSVTLHSWPQASVIKPHRVVVELDKGHDRALVSWQPQNGSCDGLQNVTYYWCHPAPSNVKTNSSFVDCQDMFDWATFPLHDDCNNASQRWVSLPTTDVKFAVSLAIDTLSGGLVWESCRFNDYSAVPDAPLFRVDPDPSNTTRLVVTVMYDACYSSDGGRPHTYLVFYQKSNILKPSFDCGQAGNLSSFQVNFDQPSMELTGLASKTNYTVCLRAGNHAGLGNYGKLQAVVTSGKQSGMAGTSGVSKWLWLIILGTVLVSVVTLPFTGTTGNSGVSKWLWLIILGTVLVSVVTLPTCFIAIKRFRQKIKPVPIEDIPIGAYIPPENGSRPFHMMDVCETAITANQDEIPCDKDSGKGSSRDGNETETTPILPPRAGRNPNSGYMRVGDGIIPPDLISCSSQESCDQVTAEAEVINCVENMTDKILARTTEGDIPNSRNTGHAGHDRIDCITTNKPNRGIVQGNISSFNENYQRNTQKENTVLQYDMIKNNSITNENISPGNINNNQNSHQGIQSASDFDNNIACSGESFQPSLNCGDSDALSTIFEADLDINSHYSSYMDPENLSLGASSVASDTGIMSYIEAMEETHDTDTNPEIQNTSNSGTKTSNITDTKPNHTDLLDNTLAWVGNKDAESHVEDKATEQIEVQCLSKVKSDIVIVPEETSMVPDLMSHSQDGTGPSVEISSYITADAQVEASIL